jgi:hypothetical protein
MKLYVGLDVGLEETNFCIVESDDLGLTVRSQGQHRASGDPLRS